MEKNDQLFLCKAPVDRYRFFVVYIKKLEIGEYVTITDPEKIDEFMELMLQNEKC